MGTQYKALHVGYILYYIHQSVYSGLAFPDSFHMPFCEGWLVGGVVERGWSNRDADLIVANPKAAEGPRTLI